MQYRLVYLRSWSMHDTSRDELEEGCTQLEETTSNLEAPVAALQEQVEALSVQMSSVADKLAAFGDRGRPLDCGETPVSHPTQTGHAAAD
jgi:uncharacterized coiled-coil protein SlyX